MYYYTKQLNLIIKNLIILKNYQFIIIIEFKRSTFLV